LVLKTLFVRSELLGGKVSKTPETSQSLSFFEKKNKTENMIKEVVFDQI
jgi:hypothetical protein